MSLPQGVQITAPLKPGYETILTADALALVKANLPEGAAKP